MARKGGVDRGLFAKTNAAGKTVWGVRLWHNGREFSFSGFASKTKARHFYEERKVEQREARLFPRQYQRRGQVMASEVIDAYLATSTKRSLKDDQRYARLWKTALSGRKLNSVIPEDILKVRQHLLDRGLAHGSINRTLAFFRHLLNLAVRDRLIPHSPMDQVSFLKESPGRLRFLSTDEEKRLLGKIGTKYAPWVRFAILTGLRQGEQFTLQWKDVNLEQGVLTLGQTKAGTVQYLPLNQEATDILRSFDYRRFTEWVFPSTNPTTHIDPINFYHRIYLPAVKAAGLEDVVWHTLRHTFASRLAMAGATESDIAACLRHSSTALVRRYAHLSPRHLKGVVEKVSEFGRQEDVKNEGSEPIQGRTEIKPGEVKTNCRIGKIYAA
jgi:site-specific recombinase XerD